MLLRTAIETLNCPRPVLAVWDQVSMLSLSGFQSLLAGRLVRPRQRQPQRSPHCPFWSSDEKRSFAWVHLSRLWSHASIGLCAPRTRQTLKSPPETLWLRLLSLQPHWTALLCTWSRQKPRRLFFWPHCADRSARLSSRCSTGKVHSLGIWQQPGVVLRSDRRASLICWSDGWAGPRSHKWPWMVSVSATQGPLALSEPPLVFSTASARLSSRRSIKARVNTMGGYTYKPRGRFQVLRHRMITDLSPVAVSNYCFIIQVVPFVFCSCAWSVTKEYC